MIYTVYIYDIYVYTVIASSPVDMIQMEKYSSMRQDDSFLGGLRSQSTGKLFAL